MKNSFLTAVWILSVLLIAATDSYAWNQYPDAILIVREYEVQGKNVLLDGSYSDDPDGYITKYEWDFTNNGTYDYWETANWHPDGEFDGKATYIYANNGNYTAKLRVTDDLGATDEDTCQFNISPDSDGDGLPNAWEELYPTILDPNDFSDADEDDDSDYYYNLNEYLHGSEPNNSNSTPDPNFNITIYVPDDVNAIQRAINASIDYDTIVVSEGVYYESIDFTGYLPNFDGVWCTLTSTDPNNWEVVANTVIDANDSNVVVVTFGANDANNAHSVIRGFTITGGGSGIYCENTSPTIRNCVVTNNNNCYNDGAAGIICYNSASPTIANCVFSDNIATWYGGGMISSYQSSPIVVNCLFSQNIARYGGGICNYESSTTLINCTFVENSANIHEGYGGYGGGMYNYHSSPVLTNCIFWDNDADDEGDEIYNDDECEPNVSYCDIEGGLNNTPGCGGNDSNDCGGNINADPCFLDSASLTGVDGILGTTDDGLRLRPDSNCIDAGDPNTSSGDVGMVDLGGDYRFMDGDHTGEAVIDMGPYELPKILYVDNDANGANNGSSWDDAYKELRDALDEANANDEIWVAEGTYKPTGGNERTASFQLVTDADVYGGFAGTEFARHQRNWIEHQTILSGNIGNQDSQNDNSYHVVKGANDAILDGFTITAGNANYTSPNNAGGGIYCSSTSPIIRNCTIAYNNSSGYGGGIYCYNALPEITNCIITDNDSSYGGGIYNYNSWITITNCIFGRNSAPAGGGAYNYNSPMFLTSCVFAANSFGDGAGMYNDHCSPTLINCTFSKNEALCNGGAIFNYYPSPAVIIINCILWGDYPDEIYEYFGSGSTVSYSDIEGNGYEGPGNIDSDPYFVDADNPAGEDDVFGTYDDGLRIKDTNSPCIDAANGDVAPLTDVLGLERVDIAGVDNNGVGYPDYVDMGAYESYDEIDSDSDGMYDDYEILNDLDPDTDDANLDKDGDGLTNKQEFNIGTWANSFDTDKDGMDDGWEYKYAPYLDPLDKDDANEDPDGDTINNLTEYNAGTNPIIYTTISVTIYEYDNAGDILKETIQDDNEIDFAVTEYEYDNLGRKWQERRWANVDDSNDSKDIITLYSYDTRSNLKETVRKAEGNNTPDEKENGDLITENFYNSLGRLTRVKDPCDGNTYYTYYKGGAVSQVTDPNGNKTTNYYDNAGRLQKVKDEEDHYRLYSYDSLGRTIKQLACDRNDNKLMQIRFQYNGLGNVTRRAVMSDADFTEATAIDTTRDMVVDYNYADSNGLLVYEKIYYNTSKTATTYYEYDGLGRRTKITDPCNNQTLFTYNEISQLIRRQQIDDDPIGSNDLTITTDYYYDSLGRLLQQVEKPNNPDEESDPSWQITTYYYDTLGNLNWEIRPDGVYVYYGYDALGQFKEKIADCNEIGDHINQTTVYDYDRLGRQVKITGYANGVTPQTTEYLYDNLDRIKEITYPDGNDIRFEYSPAGKVTKRTDQRGIVTEYIYDGIYNMIGKYVDGNNATVDANETFTYDGMGRTLTAMKKVSGQGQISKTEFRYNDISKITDTNESLFDWTKKTIQYSYDQAGNRTKTKYPYSSLEIRITPDWQGRIKSLDYYYVPSLWALATYKYIGSRVAERHYPCASNHYITYRASYDNLGRITRGRSFSDLDANVVTFDYEYDPNTNNIAKQTYVHRNNDPYTDFTYDNLDRLTRADYGIDTTYETFAIDDLGNRDQVHLRDGNTVNYDIDNLTNRYDKVGTSNLSYDAAGNLTKDKNGYTYYYDCENRLIKIKKSNDTVTVAEFSYDALGRRIRKIDSVASKTNTYYYNDNWQLLCDYSSSTTLYRYFVYGNYIDEVLMMNSSTSLVPARLYVHDQLYSPAALLSRYSGAVIERYEYDAYGKCYIMDGSYYPRSISSYGNPFYFTGREMDFLDNGNLKLNNHRHRYYDTYTGRFSTHDPSGYIDGINLYEYARSNPIIFADSSGRTCTCVCIPPVPWWLRWGLEHATDFIHFDLESHLERGGCFEEWFPIPPPIMEQTFIECKEKDIEGETCSPPASDSRYLCANTKYAYLTIPKNKCERIVIIYKYADPTFKMYDCVSNKWKVTFQSAYPAGSKISEKTLSEIKVIVRMRPGVMWASLL